MLTGVVEPKLSVGMYSAPVGLVAIAAVSATLPVEPPAAVTVMVGVLAVVAPGACSALFARCVRSSIGDCSRNRIGVRA
jgi:hypothetical protein